MGGEGDADRHGGHLGAVYAAQTPEEVSRRYDDWAETYDAEMAAAGYRHPSICLALLARHLPAGAAPLLDAGAGTGLIGSWLGILGYPETHALDISDGMLAVARRKGHYAAYHQLALGGALPFETGAYAGIVSTGVFTTGHVGPEALDELARVLRPGGVMVLTVKKSLWDGGFSARINALQADLEVIAQTEPYLSMPGEPNTAPSLCVVLRRR